MQAIDGTVYGVTYSGGLGNLCQAPLACGTIFQIAPSGEFTSIHSFCQQLKGLYCADGSNPVSLVLGSDGNLYGTTQYGGNAHGGSAAGTIFRITPEGALTTLYTFCNHTGCPDGAYPGNLVQSTDGNFYGATESSPGTIFKLDVGLPPFIETLPRFGRVGSTVTIRGNRLSSATGVSFNGTPAPFTVLSHTRIRTTVPAGATSGVVTVVTDYGTVGSKLVFSLVP